MNHIEIEALYNEVPFDYMWNDEPRRIEWDKDKGHCVDYSITHGKIVERGWVNSHDIKSALKTRISSDELDSGSEEYYEYLNSLKG